MSKHLSTHSGLTQFGNILMRVCIILSMVLSNMAIQTTSVYAYSSIEENKKEIKQIVLMESIGNRLDVTGTKHISANDLGFASGENTGAPENGYSKHTLVDVNVPSGGHALAKMALEPHAYNGAVVVQVYDTDGTPKSGVNVYAFSGTTYSGVSGVSNIYGSATLTLPDGDYRFRADLNGTQFWSGTKNTCSLPTCTTDVVTVSKPVSVYILDTDGTAKAGLSVYAFSGTTYSGYSKVSDAYGVATFTLPLGDYHFRADLFGTPFWSAETNDCTIPGCESTQVTVSKPVTVIVLDTDGPISGLNVYAFDGTTYSGYNKISNAYGVATFILPLGDYRFRADLNGTQFWSAESNHCTLPGCENAQVRVTKPITVTVVDTGSAPKPGLNVYAFDGTTYRGYSKVTDSYGVATFTLPLGDYRFRADFNGTQFWSDSINHCTIPDCTDASVVVNQPVTVTVMDTNGAPQVGLNVYAFDGIVYKNYSKTTNLNGEAVFTLPQGDYRFRVDVDGEQIWSGIVNHCTIPGCELVSVVLEAEATLTPTITSTMTITQTPTSTRTNTPTLTRTPTPTQTITRTPTRTSTQTVTRTPTRTPTQTFTRTPTLSATITQTPTNTSTVASCAGSGSILREHWDGISGGLVDDLLSASAYPDNPDSFTYETNMYYTGGGDSFGERWRGYLCPPFDGEYTIYLASDNQAKVYLSSDASPANMNLIAYIPDDVNSYNPNVSEDTDFYDYPEQSTTLNLMGGTLYYIEAYWKENIGGQFFNVAWTMPNFPGGPYTIYRDSLVPITPELTYTPTSTQTPNATITPTPTATDIQTQTETPTLTPTKASCAGTGSILRQSWNSISSASISALQTDPRYPFFPDGEEYLLSYKGPVDIGNYYGARYRGYVCAPYDGFYRFSVSSDQDSELYLSNSTDPAGMTKIAYVSGWTYNEDWTKYSSQRSGWIYLNAGQEYYTESYHVEGAGPDHFTVGWEGPNDLSGDIQVIDNHYLRLYIPEDDPVPTPETCANVGSILRQRFINISGYTISNLTSASKYPNNADNWEYHTDFDIPYISPNKDNYGERWRGYVCPPFDGDYTFYVAADDTSQLYLSTDTDPANISLIAYNNSWAPYKNYYSQSSQTSATQHLLGGTLYYVEALFKEGTASDSFTVAWTMPYYSGPIIIDGEYLVPVTPEPTYTPTITQTPTISLTPTITNTPTRTYTSTRTYTPSNTPTRTFTPTITRTPTRTPTRTFTPSKTSTLNGATSTTTITRTPTLTATSTFTPTRTFTPSYNDTAVLTLDYTDTIIPAATATSTPTEYLSPTPTSTITLFGGG